VAGTPCDRVAERLPRGPRELFLSYAQEPLVAADVLLASLDDYIAQLTRRIDEIESLDLPFARQLAERGRELVRELPDDAPEPERRVVQAGVRYLVEEEDARSDIDSPVGFADDALVLSEVETERSRS